MFQEFTAEFFLGPLSPSDYGYNNSGVASVLLRGKPVPLSWTMQETLYGMVCRAMTNNGVSLGEVAQVIESLCPRLESASGASPPLTPEPQSAASAARRSRLNRAKSPSGKGNSRNSTSRRIADGSRAQASPSKRSLSSVKNAGTKTRTPGQRMSGGRENSKGRGR